MTKTVRDLITLLEKLDPSTPVQPTECDFGHHYGDDSLWNKELGKTGDLSLIRTKKVYNAKDEFDEVTYQTANTHLMFYFDWSRETIELSRKPYVEPTISKKVYYIHQGDSIREATKEEVEKFFKK